MSDIFTKLQKLKEMYPEDIDKIEAESERVNAILRKKAFFENAGAKELAELCREQITMARKKLATDKSLWNKPEAVKELWFIIESRQWTLDNVSGDYEAELKSLESEFDNELQR